MSIRDGQLQIREIVSCDHEELKQVVGPILQKLKDGFVERLRADGDLEDGDTVRSVTASWQSIDGPADQVTEKLAKHMSILAE